MISKPIALGLLAAACVTAAGGGAFLAVRQQPAVQPEQVQAQPASAPNATPGVAESETDHRARVGCEANCLAGARIP